MPAPPSPPSLSRPPAAQPLPALSLPYKYRRKSLGADEHASDIIPAIPALSSEGSSCGSSPIATSAALSSSSPGSPTDYMYPHIRASSRDHDDEAWFQARSSTRYSSLPQPSRVSLTFSKPEGYVQQTSWMTPRWGCYDRDTPLLSDEDLDLNDQDDDDLFYSSPARRVSFTTSAERDRPYVRPVALSTSPSTSPPLLSFQRQRELQSFSPTLNSSRLPTSPMLPPSSPPSSSPAMSPVSSPAESISRSASPEKVKGKPRSEQTSTPPPPTRRNRLSIESLLSPDPALACVSEPIPQSSLAASESPETKRDRTPLTMTILNVNDQRRSVTPSVPKTACDSVSRSTSAQPSISPVSPPDDASQPSHPPRAALTSRIESKSVSRSTSVQPPVSPVSVATLPKEPGSGTSSRSNSSPDSTSDPPNMHVTPPAQISNDSVLAPISISVSDSVSNVAAVTSTAIGQVNHATVANLVAHELTPAIPLQSFAPSPSPRSDPNVGLDRASSVSLMVSEPKMDPPCLVKSLPVTRMSLPRISPRSRSELPESIDEVGTVNHDSEEFGDVATIALEPNVMDATALIFEEDDHNMDIVIDEKPPAPVIFHQPTPSRSISPVPQDIPAIAEDPPIPFASASPLPTTLVKANSRASRSRSASALPSSPLSPVSSFAHESDHESALLPTKRKSKSAEATGDESEQRQVKRFKANGVGKGGRKSVSPIEDEDGDVRDGAKEKVRTKLKKRRKSKVVVSDEEDVGDEDPVSSDPFNVEIQKPVTKRGRKRKEKPLKDDRSSISPVDPESSSETKPRRKAGRQRKKPLPPPSTSSLPSPLKSPSKLHLAPGLTILDLLPFTSPLPLDELQGMLIETLATSRASSMPPSSVYSGLVASRPGLKGMGVERRDVPLSVPFPFFVSSVEDLDGPMRTSRSRGRRKSEPVDEGDSEERMHEDDEREDGEEGEKMGQREWMMLIEAVFEEGKARCGMFGKVESSFKDEHGRPLEAQWFYVPECDPDEDRAMVIRSMMPRPGKRSVTKQYKQYYWRPLGKISRWDDEDAM